MKLIKIFIIFLFIIVLLLIDLGFVFYQEVNKTELKSFFDGEELEGYSERENIHMQEVKNLVNNLKIVLLVALILLIISLVFLFRYSQKEFWFTLLISSGLTILVVLIFVFMSIINFNWFFTIFHKLFFRSDYWLLNFDSKLIQMFPSKFFFNSGLKWFLYVIADSFIIGVISFFQLRRRFHFLAQKQ